MKQYYDLVKFVLENGYEKGDRTGTGTISYGFPPDQTYWMEDGFPLLWLKKTWFKGVVHERLWFVGALPEKYRKFGNTNIKYLVDHDVHIWDEWAYEQYVDHCKTVVRNANRDYDANLPEDNYNSQEWFINKIKEDDEFAMSWGELGPIYGKQLRRWESIKCIEKNPPEDPSDGSCVWTAYDQLGSVIQKLKNAPDSRRILINLWNVAELDEMALPPCHSVPVQFWSRPLSLVERMDEWVKRNGSTHTGHFIRGRTDKEVHKDLDSEGIPKRALSSRMYQRSGDIGLGVPFNIASDALFLHMIAQITNHIPERFVHSLGDAHIYLNHLDGMKEVLRRYEEEEHYELPTLNLNQRVKDIEEFTFDDIKLKGYQSHPHIKLPVAV